MDTAIIIALIALAASIVSAAVTTWGTPFLQGRREARAVLHAYRQPLLAAAFELQSRLHNILRGGFVEKYLTSDDPARRETAVKTTLYVFAQYFGWTEIIRREIQLLHFSRTAETQVVARLLRDISEAFLTDSFGTQLMTWRVEQRGIGERMIAPGEGRPTCIGYASFLKDLELESWLAPIERDLAALDEGGRRRLTEIQHLTLKLVRRLDPQRLRYPFELTEA